MYCYFYVQVCVADISDSQWITIFQDQAEQLLNTTSNELGALKETNKDEFEKIMDSVLFKNYNFKLRCKIETYNVSVKMVNFCDLFYLSKYLKICIHIVKYLGLSHLI